MGLFDIFKNKKEQEFEPKKQDKADSTVDDVQLEFINDTSNNAERLVKSFNDLFDNKFDYSELSLSTLDDLLGVLAENKEDLDVDMFSDIIVQAGSYIFEVARRNYGGKYFWYDNLDQPILVTGLPNFEISLLAFDKVKMRIENGKEDNIPFYFKGYSDRVKQAKQGDRSMIV